MKPSLYTIFHALASMPYIDPAPHGGGLNTIDSKTMLVCIANWQSGTLLPLFSTAAAACFQQPKFPAAMGTDSSVI